MNDYQHQLTHPIVLKRGNTLAAPVLLWLMDALPAVLAGVMFYPLTRLYDVEYDKPFLVLSILAASFTLAVLKPGNSSSQIISGRLELATNLLLRWAVLVAALRERNCLKAFESVSSVARRPMSARVSPAFAARWKNLVPLIPIQASLQLAS